MKISEIMEQLAAIKAEVGDIECLIEVMHDDVQAMVSCGEVAYEERDVYGKSVAFLV